MLSIFRKNIEMESLLRERAIALRNAETRVKEKNELIKNLQKELKESKNRIIDLENNIDFLVNQLPEKIKEVLVDDSESDN